MPTIRRCCIIGCNSNSREKPNLQFFQFPKPESQFHHIWKQSCIASLSRIMPFKKPVVCALHFSPRCIGGRRLTYSAVPTINLDVPSNLKDVEQKAMSDEIERSRKCAYINAVVYEWLVRANLNPNLRGSITHGMIKDKADAAKGIISLDSFVADNRWLNRFRETHLQGFAAKLADKQLKPLGTSLWIPDIVKDLEHVFPPTSVDSMEHLPEQYFNYMDQYGEYEDDDERHRNNQSRNSNQNQNNHHKNNNKNNNNNNNNNNKKINNNNNNNNNNSHITSHKVFEKRAYEQNNSNSNSPPHSSTSLSPPLLGFSPIKRSKMERNSSSPETNNVPETRSTPAAHTKNDADDDDVQVITQPIHVQDLTADDDMDMDDEVDRLSSTKIGSSYTASCSYSGTKSTSISASAAATATPAVAAPARKITSVMKALKNNSPRYVLKLKNTSVSNRNGTPDYVSRISPKGFSDNCTESGYNSASNSANNATINSAPISVPSSKLRNALTEQKELQTYEDALEYLKPLEDFVLIKENFRAIGLISQLEIILRRGVSKATNARE